MTANILTLTQQTSHNQLSVSSIHLQSTLLLMLMLKVEIFTGFIFAGLCGERRPRPRGGEEGQAARLQQRAQDEGAGGGGAAQLHPGHPGQPPAVVPR